LIPLASFAAWVVSSVRVFAGLALARLGHPLMAVALELTILKPISDHYGQVGGQVPKNC
jgi:hypothetical protein